MIIQTLTILFQNDYRNLQHVFAMHGVFKKFLKSGNFVAVFVGFDSENATFGAEDEK